MWWVLLFGPTDGAFVARLGGVCGPDALAEHGVLSGGFAGASDGLHGVADGVGVGSFHCRPFLLEVGFDYGFVTFFLCECFEDVCFVTSAEFFNVRFLTFFGTRNGELAFHSFPLSQCLCIISWVGV